jgi:hypothetical protein
VSVHRCQDRRVYATGCHVAHNRKRSSFQISLSCLISIVPHHLASHPTASYGILDRQEKMRDVWAKTQDATLDATDHDLSTQKWWETIKTDLSQYHEIQTGIREKRSIDTPMFYGRTFFIPKLIRRSSARIQHSS